MRTFDKNTDEHNENVYAWNKTHPNVIRVYIVVMYTKHKTLLGYII